MSADPTPDFPEAEDPSPLPPEMGHSEIACDIDSNIGSNYELSDIQYRAIELTIQGLSDVQIAKMLSIARRTLWRWKTYDDEYRLALSEARSQIHAAVADRYRTLLMPPPV